MRAVSKLILASTLALGHAFVNIGVSTTGHGRTTAAPSVVVLSAAAIPQVDKWKLMPNGAIQGTAKGHPTIPNGDIITTSPITVDTLDLKENQVVSTKSGSKYKLGKASIQQQRATLALKSKAAAQVKAEAAAAAKASASTATAVAPPAAKAAPTEADRRKELLQRQREAKAQFNLNGKTIGNGKYLLVGQQIRSSSKRSKIYYAYKSDDDGLPVGPRLTAKISETYDRLERENKNYEMVTAGLFRGQFVKKVEFLPEANCSPGVGSKNSCALVLESGERNLRDLCSARQNVGLTGTAMRQAAVAIAQCIQAVHSSGLVWTDLKAENFVTTTDSLGDKTLEGIKGIDLESTVKVGGPPIDYSPEACPPEFAKEEAAGRGTDFLVAYNYDSWSFGILLYELSVGKSIFGKMRDNQIANLLKQDTFEPDISAVEDDRLRDLIKQCLELDPRKRPEITQILLHPYFLTTGIGPFSF